MAKPKSKQSKKQREARRAYMRNWYRAHREQQIAYQKAYRRVHSLGHAEERRARSEKGVELVRGGMARKAVAKEMGVHVETVRRWCRKAGLRAEAVPSAPPKPAPPAPKPAVPAGASEETGKSRREYLAWCLRPSVVAECVKSARRKQREEEDDNRFYH